MSNTSSDRPTSKLTPEELLGLVRHTRAKTNPEQAPELDPVVMEALAQGTQESKPIRIEIELEPVVQVEPALQVESDVQEALGEAPVGGTGGIPLSFGRTGEVPALPHATTELASGTAIDDRPSPIGAIIGFALVGLAYAVGAYLVLV